MDNSPEKLVVTHWIFQWQWFQFYDESKFSFENFFFLFKDFKFCVCFWSENSISKKYTYLAKCTQRVNVQYKVFTLSETKPGKKLWPNVSLLF